MEYETDEGPRCNGYQSPVGPADYDGNRHDGEVRIWSSDQYRVVEPASYDPISIRRAAKLLA